MTKNEINREAMVYYGQDLAGQLSKRIEKGKVQYEFQYAPSYLENPRSKPISLMLSLQKEKYISDKLFPFFEGLLPEGWLLELTSTTLNIDPDDQFELLLHTGTDTVGAVTVIPKE